MAQFCGRTRREFLWQAGGGFTSLALAYLLDRDGFFARRAGGALPAAAPALKTVPHFAPKAKSVIFLFMYGGVSQVDTFDYKPELQKRDGDTARIETRRHAFNEGKLLASRRTFRQHGRCGHWISDLFPHVATCADDFTVLRACHADGLNHVGSVCQMNTGSILAGRPSLGSWALYGLGTVNQNLPGFVVFTEGGG